MAKGTFRDLILPEEKPIIEASFEKIIAGSFAEDQATFKASAVKERFEILVEGYCQLYDLKWSRQRILDNLPKYLHAKLNGIPWEPSKRGTWTARDEGQLG